MTTQNSKLEALTIDGLTHDGRGVGHFEGKAIFVADAIPGDIVSAKVIKHHDNFDDAKCIKIESDSKDRVEPFCPVYTECGGCQLQHMSVEGQLYWKNKNFITKLIQAVDAKQCEVANPITSIGLNYRRRARLSLVISKKDKVARLGFKQRASSTEVVDIDSCPILTGALNRSIQENKAALLETASRAYKEVTFVEAENGVFGVHDSNESAALPFYTLNINQPLKLEFPEDGFIQVNKNLNEAMVENAMAWLDLKPEHKVLDLFCGVGNFTLPIAQKVKETVGIEGERELVDMAKSNAEINQLDGVAFHKANLFDEIMPKPWFKKQKYDRILLDPGRQGAYEACKVLGKLNPHIIVYISCNAATLTRDVKELEKQGYRLTKAGMIDMFPHTTHTEVMVQLTRTHKAISKPKKRPVFKI
ncbi:MAG: 23S rRNA (uracil1939-C5)-methyltransferase [Thiomicrorhabdus sp.]|nr:MAG: 23S rRNA (uracil1939-C5)-methyltransferase [Thiomicrorhabdus sp.]